MQSRITHELLVKSLFIIPGTTIRDNEEHVFSESELNHFFRDCVTQPITLEALQAGLITEFDKPEIQRRLFQYCDKVSTRLKPVDITFSRYDEENRKIVFKSATRYGIPQLDLRILDILLMPKKIRATHENPACGLTSLDILPVCDFLLDNPIVLLKDLSAPGTAATNNVKRIYKKLSLQLSHLRQSDSELDELVSCDALTPIQRSTIQMQQAKLRQEKIPVNLSKSGFFNQASDRSENKQRLSMPARINRFKK